MAPIQETSVSTYHAYPIMPDGGNSAVIDSHLPMELIWFEKHLSTLRI